MIVQLYRSDERYFPPREVASRLAQSLPTVLIDWNRGNRMVEESLQRLVEQNPPEVILQSHRAKLDNTVYIEFRLPEYPGQTAFTVVESYKSVFLEPLDCSTESFLRTLADRIAKALEYSIAIR